MSANATLAPAAFPVDCVSVSKIRRKDSVGSAAARLHQQLQMLDFFSHALMLHVLFHFNNIIAFNIPRRLAVIFFCHFWVKIALPVSVLTFSTPADLYLHFPCLHFPLMQFGTCDFHTCIFHPCQSYLGFPYLCIPSPGTYVFRPCIFSRPVKSNQLAIKNGPIKCIVKAQVNTRRKTQSTSKQPINYIQYVTNIQVFKHQIKTELIFKFTIY